MKPTYSELLKDPRWQRKRLKIMEANNFYCESCGRNDSQLSIHHGYYERNKKPWEYDDCYLFCLCNDCHEEYQSKKTEIDRVVGGMNLSQLTLCLRHLKCLNCKNGEPFKDRFFDCEGHIKECFDQNHSSNKR